MTNYPRYLGLLIATFPELRAKLKKYGDIYIQTALFADFANATISRGDWGTLKKCYALMDRVLDEEPDEDVCNAVHVSFIEHLDFSSDPINGPQAKKLLSQQLLQGWNELEEYWRTNAPKKRKW